MCGIFGLLELTGRAADPSALIAMGDVIVHRGPDDKGGHLDGPCGIGMRRLSIIDLSGGHQPIANTDESLWVVCNGEIYNYRELTAELVQRGCSFRTNSDSEVLIHAYAEYGDGFVDRLNGMFGFALWDVRRRRLIVGRDRLGIKPIYYREAGGQLAFASEAKSLLMLPGVEREVDPVALQAYLELGYVPAPHSMFRGIRKLPPASLLIAEAGNVSTRRYWSPPQHTDSTLAQDEWISRIRGQIGQSVRMQMVSDVPIGAFLSGGIDSSAVVACMAAGSDQPIKTYSIGFRGSRADEYYNELPHARRIANLFKTDHHEILVRPDVASLLPRLLWHMDEPVADTAFITTYLVSEFARKDVKVILSGVGGDEVFGGYRRYLGDHMLERFNRLPRTVRRMAARASAMLPSDRHSPVLNMFRYAQGFLSTAEQPLAQRYDSYIRVFGRDAARNLMLAPPAVECHAIADAFAQASADDPLNQMLTVDLETQLPDDLLMLTDKMSMATSLECRVPLLDHELVELGARMPQSVKISGGRLKHAMKEALRGLLPPEILDRKKRGFGTPMGAWLKDELNPVLRSVLSPGSLAARGFFRASAVEELIDAHLNNRIDGTDPLIALLNFEVWSRVYLDRRSHEDVAAELKTAMA